MNAGKLNRRLIYQEPGDGTPDSLGQTPEVWTQVAKPWAEIRTPTGSEVYKAEQLSAVLSHVITIRRPRSWFPRAIGRFVYQTSSYNPVARIFNVTAAFDPDESNTWVSCLTIERPFPPNG